MNWTMFDPEPNTNGHCRILNGHLMSTDYVTFVLYHITMFNRLSAKYVIIIQFCVFFKVI